MRRWRSCLTAGAHGCHLLDVTTTLILDILSLWDFSCCLWTQDKTRRLITLVLITSLTGTMEHLALFVGWKSISVALKASRHWTPSLLRVNTSTHLIFRTITLHSDMHLPGGEFKWSWLTHAGSFCVDWCPCKLTKFSETVEEKLAWPAEHLENIEYRLLAGWLVEIIILIPRTAYSLINVSSLKS